jgi:hypothetical protein
MNDTGPWRDHRRSQAVLLGAWGYTRLAPVPAAYHSLTRMNGLLTGPLCGWPAQQVRVIPDAPNCGDLPDLLMRQFDGVTDVALFYFVGHGQLHDDELCLALTESPKNGPRRLTTGLPFAAVRRALRECDAQTKIVILDCCFSGFATLPGNTLGATAAAVDVIEKASGTGAFTMAASGPYQTAWHEPDQDTGNPQTYFTKYLINTIEQGLPHHHDDLSLRLIFDHTDHALARDRLPRPRRSVRDDADLFIFAHNAALLSSTRPQQPIRPEVTPPSPVPAAQTMADTNGQQTPPWIGAQPQPQPLGTWGNGQQYGGNPGSGSIPYPTAAPAGPPQATVPPFPAPTPVHRLEFRPSQGQQAFPASSLLFGFGSWLGSLMAAWLIFGSVIGFFLAIVLGILAGVKRSRSTLVLTENGVFIRRLKTTFIRWSEIKVVRVDRLWVDGRLCNHRGVRFVLGNGSKMCWIPVDGWGMRDSEFDHKVWTIQQWHVRFGSPEPGWPGE